MERYFGLAELASKSSLHSLAHSALPNAPVQPCVDARGRRITTALARLRSPARRPAVAMRRTRLTAVPRAGC